MVEVQSRVWPVVVRSQGSLVADEVAVVGTKVAGRVGEVFVDLGDFVRTGQPLVTLDQEEFRLEVEQAVAQLAQARAAVGLKPDDPVASLKPENAPPVRQEKAIWDEARAAIERAKRLLTQNAITQAELDQVEAAERVAEARYASATNSVQEKIALIGVRSAELDLARQRLQETAILAPFDGLVEQRAVAVGAYVQVGDEIATLVRTNPLRFRGTIPERHAQQLAIGDEVRLKIESVPDVEVARVSRISPAIDSQSRALLFEAIVDNKDARFRSGLFAEAEVVLDPGATAVVIPRSAVVEFAGVEKVWMVVDGKSVEQEILISARNSAAVSIAQGLAIGDRVLLDGSQGKPAIVTEVDLTESAVEHVVADRAEGAE